MNTQTIALFFLATVATGGVAWVFIYPSLSGERTAEKRKDTVVRSASATPMRTARTSQKSRREQVEGSLKELEIRSAKANSPPLATRIHQAGLTWSKQRFFITGAIMGIVTFVLFLMINAGLPFWILRFLKKRREAKFLAGFPDAVDIIVRGIKAGLPLLDCLRMITVDTEEPLKSEFRSIIETQAIGIPIGDACAKLYERIPLPEANFFGIVISIQQRAGGNLSEALGNLSKVLRERKKMKAKIQAMSMEAKASASIIACLPLAVMTLVYLSSPDYISLLWTEPQGRTMLVCSAAWMSTGVFVMKKMINFDF
jgi:tight adherence protein B